MLPFEHFRRLVPYRTLLQVLTGRELKARYRGSVLGWAWSLVNPLLVLAVYAIVFQLVFRRVDPSTEPYALFLFTGLLPWNWASSTLLDATASLPSNSNLVRKVLFPAEILPLVYALSQLVHFLLALPILLAGLAVGALVVGHPFPVTILLPAVIVLQLVFVSGLSLVLAPLAVHFRDLRDLVGNLLHLGFFLTPILYPVEAIPLPALRTLVAANPAAVFVLAFQDLAFHGRIPGPGRWAAMVLLAAAAWWLGVWVFERLRDGLVEEV